MTTAASTGRSVWVTTDGRPGNQGPALALARALEKRGFAPPEVRQATPKSWPAKLPAAIWQALPAREGGWPFTALQDDGAALQKPWPDLVISAGRRSAPVAAAMRKLSGGATHAVQILDPGMSPASFDALIVPEHDRLDGPNVIRTAGSLSWVTPGVAAAEAKVWEPVVARLPRPRIAVLVGGPSSAAPWSPTFTMNLIAAIEQIEAAGWGVMATLSRRSPPCLGLALRRASPRGFIWNGEGANPYPGILGLADAALVTADSVNMVSEAGSAGLPVFVIGMEDVTPKLQRFHESMIRVGVSRPWDGRLHLWSAPVLNEVDRAAGALVDMLGEGAPGAAG